VAKAVRWLIALVALATASTSFFAAPTALAQDQGAALSAQADRAFTGGIELVLEVDQKSVLQERLERLSDEMRSTLRGATPPISVAESEVAGDVARVKLAIPDGAGARTFCWLSEANVGKPFAVVLDGRVLTAPVINEPICGGHGVISGEFTREDTQELALLLMAGALPAMLTVVEQRTIGAH
jgi:preprotein translocase subunit SecD